jgi:hypothetical protein
MENMQIKNNFSHFKEKQPSIPDMVVNENNIFYLENLIASFIATQFDNLNMIYTLSHVRSAITRVKNIKNSEIFDLVLEKVKNKPYQNLSSYKKLVKEKPSDKDDELINMMKNDMNALSNEFDETDSVDFKYMDKTQKN